MDRDVPIVISTLLLFESCGAGGSVRDLKDAMEESQLAAIHYELGLDINALFRAVGAELRRSGVEMRGVLQYDEEANDAHSARMLLLDLQTDQMHQINQDLGPHASGCKLDTQRLAGVAGLVSSSLATGGDLLIVNKFGKAESEGHGLLSCFGEALGAGMPVLTSVREPYFDPWAEFHSGMAAKLAPDEEQVIAWCRSAARRAQAAETASF